MNRLVKYYWPESFADAVSSEFRILIGSCSNWNGKRRRVEEWEDGTWPDVVFFGGVKLCPGLV